MDHLYHDSNLEAGRIVRQAGGIDLRPCHLATTLLSTVMHPDWRKPLMYQVVAIGGVLLPARAGD